MLHFQRDDAAVLIEAEFGVIDLVAAMIVGHEGLAAVAAPFHRTAGLARRPGDDAEFGIDLAANAEAAADVGRDHPHLVGRKVEHALGDAALDAAAALRRRIEREFARVRIPFRDRAARLHRVGHEAVVHDVDDRAILRLAMWASISALGRFSQCTPTLLPCSSQIGGLSGDAASAVEPTAGSVS